MYTFNMGRRFLDKGKRGKKISVFFTALKLAMTYKSGDKFILTEYLHRDSYQILFAKIIRFIRPKAPVYAMVHLVPEKLERRYSKAQIKKSSRFVTEIVTLGSSLTCYLNNLGIENVYTSFHYVDNNYYTPSANLYNRSDDVKVIVMGALARDFEQIAYIVSRLPQIHFYICKGRENIDYLFSGLKNVTLVGYVPEAELKHYMNDSDISLNVMKDTIGSNVICTSMATGLAMVYNADGEIIKSTENITNDDLVYMGTLTPKYFGGFFNTFTYKGLSLYVGITYKLGYIFQKPTISQPTCL